MQNWLSRTFGGTQNWLSRTIFLIAYFACHLLFLIAIPPHVSPPHGGGGGGGGGRSPHAKICTDNPVCAHGPRKLLGKCKPRLSLHCVECRSRHVSPILGLGTRVPINMLLTNFSVFFVVVVNLLLY